MIWILMGVAEAICLLAWVAIYVSTTTAPEGEHAKPKPEVLTVETYVERPKTHKAKHKRGRFALAA